MTDEKQLYQNTFGDTDAFTAYYFSRRMFASVIRDEKGVAALAHIVPRLYRTRAIGCGKTRTGIVSGVCVREDVRGKGLGKAVMRAVEQDAKKHGYVSLYLSPAKGVEGFYESLGYRTVLWSEQRTVPQADPNGPRYHAVRYEDCERALARTYRPLVAFRQAISAFFMELSEHRIAFDPLWAIECMAQEARAGGTLWLIHDSTRIVGVCLQEGKTLGYALTLRHDLTSAQKHAMRHLRHKHPAPMRRMQDRTESYLAPSGAASRSRIARPDPAPHVSEQSLRTLRLYRNDRDDVDATILAQAEWGKCFPFVGCNYDHVAASPTHLTAPRPFVQELILDPDRHARLSLRAKTHLPFLYEKY